jgi:hypothetical protein
MPYTIPSFPLLCNIWHNQVAPPVGPPDLTNVQCSLGGLPPNGLYLWTGITPGATAIIRLPAGTDLRDIFRTPTVPPATQPDVIELPAGSGTYYVTIYVERIGQGFASDHLRAYCDRVRPHFPL